MDIAIYIVCMLGIAWAAYQWGYHAALNAVAENVMNRLPLHDPEPQDAQESVIAQTAEQDDWEGK